MKRLDEKLSIGEVAESAGISVRTLRLYDEMELLKPSARTIGGYRLYGADDLLRLQQILFFKELELPLIEIKEILDKPGFSYVETLSKHRNSLQKKVERLEILLKTLDRSISSIKGESPMLKIEELYEGFAKEKAERYEAEATEKWGGSSAYKQSKERIGKMKKEEWKAVMARGEEITTAFADACRSGAAVDGPLAQSLCVRWTEHLRAFYEPTAEILEGLASMYVDNDEFRANYEALAPGLAEWLRSALLAYAHTLK
ncbi:MerR family transcriptional regulator [Treponema sp.]